MVNLERKPSDIRFIDRRALNGLTPIQKAIAEENDSDTAGLILCGVDISQNTFRQAGVVRTPLVKAINEFLFFDDFPIPPNFINIKLEMKTFGIYVHITT